jgi:hypothetical protein
VLGDERLNSLRGLLKYTRLVQVRKAIIIFKKEGSGVPSPFISLFRTKIKKKKISKERTCTKFFFVIIPNQKIFFFF